jgi:hypothetical protein
VTTCCSCSRIFVRASSGSRTICISSSLCEAAVQKKKQKKLLFAVASYCRFEKNLEEEASNRDANSNDRACC